MTEMDKLAEGLKARNIEFIRVPLYDGEQLICGKRKWDVICHSYSYGHEYGLLEAMGLGMIDKDYDNDIVGFLTAQDILDHLDKVMKGEKNE